MLVPVVSLNHRHRAMALLTARYWIRSWYGLGNTGKQSLAALAVELDRMCHGVGSVSCEKPLEVSKCDWIQPCCGLGNINVATIGSNMPLNHVRLWLGGQAGVSYNCGHSYSTGPGA